MKTKTIEQKKKKTIELTTTIQTNKKQCSTYYYREKLEQKQKIREKGYRYRELHCYFERDSRVESRWTMKVAYDNFEAHDSNTIEIVLT